jgi:hypothetical protein
MWNVRAAPGIDSSGDALAHAGDVGLWDVKEGPMSSSAQRARPMTVGELSRRTGVPIKNLRQYTDWA